MIYTEDQINQILTAVKDVLMADEDNICAENAVLLETAIEIGLVNEEDCNLG